MLSFGLSHSLWLRRSLWLNGRGSVRGHASVRDRLLHASGCASVPLKMKWMNKYTVLNGYLSN